jgi:hypothetical protein
LLSASYQILPWPRRDDAVVGIAGEVPAWNALHEGAGSPIAEHVVQRDLVAAQAVGQRDTLPPPVPW